MHVYLVICDYLYILENKGERHREKKESYMYIYRERGKEGGMRGGK